MKLMIIIGKTKLSAVTVGVYRTRTQDRLKEENTANPNGDFPKKTFFPIHQHQRRIGKKKLNSQSQKLDLQCEKTFTFASWFFANDTQNGNPRSSLF